MRFVLVGLILLLCGATTSFALPQLVVDSSLIDWGSIYSGEKREHRFILKNMGDTPLVVEHVHSSCGCTAAMVSSKTILPAEQTELRVRFDSKNFRGRVTKKVYVVSNDPQQPKMRFSLQAQVVPELSVSPSRLSLGTMHVGDVIEKKVKFANQSDVAIAITAFRSTSRYIALTDVPDTIQPGQEVILTVTIRPTSSAKAVLSGYLLIDVRGHARNQLRIPVSTKVIR